MKISVSLPDEDVRFLDAFVQRSGRSRSAAVHEAILSLRDAALGDAYAQAWEQWDADGDPALWEQAAGDGL